MLHSIYQLILITTSRRISKQSDIHGRFSTGSGCSGWLLCQRRRDTSIIGAGHYESRLLVGVLSDVKESSRLTVGENSSIGMRGRMLMLMEDGTMAHEMYSFTT